MVPKEGLESLRLTQSGKNGSRQVIGGMRVSGSECAALKKQENDDASGGRFTSGETG
jgi:hypothetical protein